MNRIAWACLLVAAVLLPLGCASSGRDDGGDGGDGGSSYWGEPPRYETDAAGYSLLQPGPGARTYYVSNDGDDGNSGTSASAPLESMEAAFARMQDGDWLLLHRGDTFGAIPRWVNGTSTAARSVIGAYGEESLPRPIIDPRGDAGLQAQGGGQGLSRIEHFALVSLHFRQSRKPPGSGERDSGASGIAILRTGSDILIEDVKVELFGNGINLLGEGDGLHDVTIRRSVIVDSYSNNEDVHSQGIFADNVHGLRIEETVLDHNGFNEAVPGASRVKFNHNVYLYGSCSGLVLERNISSRGSNHGFTMNNGGRAEGNILIANAIAGYVKDLVASTEAVQIMRNNVALHGAVGPEGSGLPGWGLRMYYSPDQPTRPSQIIFSGNIAAHADPDAAEALYVEPESAEVANNAAYDWGRDADTALAFPHPERTIGTYDNQVSGQSRSEPAAREHFYAEIRGQRRGGWNPSYTARNIRAYFAEAFGLPE